MRTQRRPLAIAATCASTFLGVVLVAGVQPAAAAAQNTTSDAVTNCAATSVGSQGMLDAALLQECLDVVQRSLSPAITDREPAADPSDETEAAPAEEAIQVSADAPVFEALDAVFRVDEPAPTAVAEEAAPVDDGRGDAFAALAECESGGNYTINTGNGYYGAYQFSLSTWQSLGYDGYPHQASAAVQDQAARELQSLYGWGQWPGCSWYLGL